jgi:two-component system sensor histidine kinase CpxA
MRTSLAVKIFFSFWLVHALIFVVLAVAPDPGAREAFLDRARDDGHVAASFFEEAGPQACARFLGAIEGRRHRRTVLLAEGDRPACGAAVEADPATYRQVVAEATPDGAVREAGGQRIAAVSVVGPSGRAYKAVSVRPSDAPDRPRRPVPYGFLFTSIVVSGLVCVVFARYLASPLQRMRAATHRLREGDLSARAAAGVESRRDEIGDVVRDFDAMAERIELLMQAQQQLLSDISHELRSPLARLNVALELARRTAGDGAAAHLARIEGEAERMNELIGRLLALSRAETAGQRHTEEFDLAEILERVTDDAQYEAHRKGTSVGLSLSGKARLRGDPVLLASAIENVVRNAVKYAPPESQVEVTSTVGGGMARVVVRDHGAGVPEAELERVFLPFHRVDASRDRVSGGTGLGLSIAQRAIASQGGTITATNAEEGGLEVIVTLPLAL